MTTINDINDLVRILRENPDWADAVRGVLLSKDLLDLPETAARMARLTAETAEGTHKALQMLEELTRRSANQGGTLTRLDGAHYQNHVALHGFGPLATRLDLSRIRLLHNSQADQGTALRAHLQDLGINPDQPDAHSLALVDLVYTATCRDQEVYVLCEVSLTVEHDGFTRARDRSRTLTRLTRKAHPGHRHRDRPGPERNHPGPGEQPARGRRRGLRPGIPRLNHVQATENSTAHLQEIWDRFGTNIYPNHLKSGVSQRQPKANPKLEQGQRTGRDASETANRNGPRLGLKTILPEPPIFPCIFLPALERETL